MTTAVLSPTPRCRGVCHLIPDRGAGSIIVYPGAFDVPVAGAKVPPWEIARDESGRSHAGRGMGAW